MTREDATQQVTSALDELAAALERGHSEQLATYLATMARFPRYSLNNVLLIATQRPDATYVAGFQAWKKLGRFVRKGESGIAIVAPMVYRNNASQTREHVASSSDQKTTDGDIRGFKVAHVFDISQTDGETLPQFAEVTGDPGLYAERLKDFLATQAIDLQYDDIPDGADGMYANNTIVIRPGLSAAEHFSVLAHETAHALLHKGERRAQTTKTIRETEAEAVSFVVSRAVGLDTSTHSADYIQLYHGDRTILIESLTHIQKTALQIITSLQSVAAAVATASPC